MFLCQFCETQCTTTSTLVSHLWHYHQNRPNLQIPCSTAGCPRTFRTFPSLRSHLSRNHDGARINLDVVELDEINGDRQDEEDDEMNEDIHDDRQDVEVDDINNDEGPNNNDVDQDQGDQRIVHNEDFSQDVATSFLLKLKSKNVTEPIMNIVVENVAVLINVCVNEFKEEVSEALNHEGLDIDTYLDVPAAVKRVSGIFDDINNRWMRNKAFKESLHLVQATRINLNDRIVLAAPADVGKNRPSKVYSDTLMYVPLNELIQKFLSNRHFQDLLKPLEPSVENVLASYADGSKYKNDEYFRLHPNALKPLVYYDEVNLVDTASTRPVQMAFFYLSFLDIHPEYRSLCQNISLVVAVEGEVMRLATIGEVIRPLLEDLKLLERGITGPQGNIVYGKLFSLLGDNLAAHKLGGFKECFSGESSCRYCHVKRDVFRKLTLEDMSLLRSRRGYEDHIANMNNLKDIIKNPDTGPRERTLTQNAWEDLSKQGGVNRECEFNELETFHVIGGIPPDPFHDIILGCLARHLQLLLRHYLIDTEDFKKVMTLKCFNEKLTAFDYGYSDTKPSIILESHLRRGGNLHQTGAQMWSLGVMFPFTIGSAVDYDDPFWKNYLLLLEVMALVFANKISRRMVALMQCLIDEYLTDFMDLFGTHLIPKQHYLTHYPRLTMEFGPLSQYSTARYEGKHQYFVDMMRKFKCMKNPSFTTANQHQLYQANLLTGPLKQLDQQGPLKKKALCTVAYRTILPNTCDIIQFVPWVEFNGVIYKSMKCFVVVGHITPLPQFALIHDIVYLENEFVFVCKTYKTEERSFHLNAYQISSKAEYKLFRLKDLLSHETYHCHFFENQTFISVRRSFGDIY